jgi:hypothetical protein
VSRALRALTRSIAASGLALALGCATGRTPAPVPLGSDDPRPVALFATLTRDAASRHSLRGVARLAVDGPAGSARAKQILALERPARLRVEILGLLDATQAVLSTDGVQYRLVRSQDRSVERGAVYDALLADVAGLAVTPQAAVRILLGAPQRETARLEGAAQLQEGGIRLLLRSPGALEREQLDCDAAGNVTQWKLLGADGDALLEARYADYQPLGAVAFAHDVEVRDARSGASVGLAWSRVELNPVLAPELFATPETAP